MGNVTKPALFGIALLTGLACTSRVRAQADPITQQQAHRLLAAAAAHINEILGVKVVVAERNSVKAPKLEFLSMADFRHAPDADVDALVHLHFPQLAGKALERAQEAARDACARVALARYRPGTDAIAIAVPLDDRRIATWSPVALPDPPELASERMLQLALVHEVIRLHLDRQHSWHEHLSKSHNEEENQVFRALVAGRALQLTERVADRLGSVFYSDLLAQRYRVVPDEGPDPERLTVVRAAIFQDRFRAATDGKALFAYLASQNVENPEKVAFTQPPHQAFWIERPELYVKALRGQIPGLREVLSKVAPAPPRYQAMPQPLTPDMVREAAAMFKEQARVEPLLRTWEEGHALVWVAPGDPSQIVLSVTRFSSPEAARAYHGFAIDLQRKRDEQMSSNCTGTCRVLESKCENADITGATAATRWTKKMQVGNAAPVATNMLYVLAGNLIIEIDGFRVDPDPGWTQRAVDAILGAYPTAAATKPASAVE
jgi:hypothetical protein